MSEINGKAISAKLVIKLAIQFLRTHLLDQFKQRNIGVNPDEIKWIITVPAIWNDACKQFMRDAAEEAGIHGDMFSIVYEPEAASVYARLLPVESFAGRNKTTILRTFDPGTKFIVVDAGGNVELWTFLLKSCSELKFEIIHKVGGGSWGGEIVNENYRIVLTKLVGGPVLQQFKREQGADYNEMMRDFERKKKTYKLGSETVIIRFPVSLKDLTTDSMNCSIDSLINESTFKESDVLQDAVRKAFPKLEVFVPVDGGLSVLKGAVIYGHNPNIVASRVCNYTYGISLSVPFKNRVHPESKRYSWDNEEWCREKFHVCFKADSVVTIGTINKLK
ncbi:unnamed protein product [Mytilus edulis]|uniref:Heat shock 70 kDa protein 12A n=1 Tax=Mytilus edulis TaxID=6550 RepID=A0A8S3PMB1_MYTED|nr:unnamed protein product [Mytilus edulis]